MSFSNPRRTAGARQDADATNGLTPKTNSTLRKGATFHSPTPPASPPVFKVPSLPRRSQTNLDDVVDAHRRRAAMTIGHIEDTLATINLDGASHPAFQDNSLPIPRGVLGHTLLEDNTMDSNISNEMEKERRVLHTRRRSRHHESDSGLGSSIASLNQKMEGAPPTASAINHSAAASETQSIPRLSERAVNRIHEHTLGPLLEKPSLQEFRPIVLDCPRRIQENQVICLRDLEKTLIFMAPERAKTAELYLDFCLTSIRCIQATVEYLTDREQTRPHDRPYSEGYFIDLVEQIHQHAQLMKESREKLEAGEALGEMDVDPTDELKLVGGLTKNGRPAELVRVKKNGQAVSLTTGELIDDYEDNETRGPIRFKRSMSEQLEDEEEIMRSMARRKKNATPEELAPKKCKEPGCTKEFKRPCDLTKHEKTHSRPWKCPVATCKYHDYGWPTEKEMDRHVNDKHSAAPPMYECKFKPCPYKSKRESNCKQHMEKAHGWQYVRTKSNGSKKGESKAGGSAKATPLINNLPTPNSDHSNSVMTPPEENPFTYNPQDFPAYPSSEEFNANVGLFEPQMYDADIQLDFSPQDFSPQDFSPQDFTGEDLSPVDNATPSTDAGQFNTYQDLSPEFTGQFEDIYGAHVQVPTPPNQIYAKNGLEAFTNFMPESYQAQPTTTAPTAPHISPVGQGNAMLFTPSSMADVDEGFEDYTGCQFGDQMGGGDFCLFPQNGMPSKQDDIDNLFGTVAPMAPSLAGGFTQPSSQDFSMDFGQQMEWSSSDFQNFPTQS